LEISASVGFIEKKFVTKHGHMNVKHADCLTLTMKAQQCFETSVNIYLSTRRHIPHDLKLCFGICLLLLRAIAIGCFICVNINLVRVLKDISSFVISGDILFKMLVLGINEMVSHLSSEVLKGYSLFFIYKISIFIKLLNLNANVVIFFCYLLLWCLGLFFES